MTTWGDEEICTLSMLGEGGGEEIIFVTSKMVEYSFLLRDIAFDKHMKNQKLICTLQSSET